MARVIAFDPVCAALAEGLGLPVEATAVEPADDDIVLLAGVEGLQQLAEWRRAGRAVRVVLRTVQSQLERERLEPVALLRENSPRALRRALQALDEGPELEPVVLEHGVADLARRRFLGPGGEKRLTELECQLLAYLAARPGREVSRQELQAQVWGHRASVKTRAVDMVVFRLRRKIEAHPKNPTSLLTAHRGGYRLVPGYRSIEADEPVPAPRSPRGASGRLLPAAARDRLMQGLAAAGRPRDELWVERTLDLVDGLPDLVDAAAREALPPDTLARCLAEGGPPALQAVLDRIDATLADLPPPDAALISTLSRLQHVELGGLTGLTGLTESAWAGLEGLRRRGLVWVEGDRVGVPKPLATRARQHFADSEEAARARRAWLRSLALEVVAASEGFEARSTAARLVAVHVDLRAAIPQAVAAGEHEAALDLVEAQESLGPDGGTASERARNCELLLASLAPSLRPRGLFLLARAQANHQRARAIEALDEGLAAVVDPELDARLRAHAAYLLPFVGRIDDALELLHHPPEGCSPRLRRRLAAEAVRLGCRKRTYSGPEAIERLQAASDELLDGGDLDTGVRLGRALATAQQNDGHLDDAELTLRRLLVWQQSLANRAHEAGLELQRALLIWGRQRPGEALEGLGRALALVEAVEPGWAAYISAHRGAILLQLGRHTEAREAADLCRRWAVRQGSTADRFYADITLSLVEADLGCAERAELLAARAIEGCEPDTAPFVQGLLRTQLARSLVEQGRFAEALSALEPTRIDQLSAAPLAELRAIELLAHRGLGRDVAGPLGGLSQVLHGAEFPAAEELRGVRTVFASDGPAQDAIAALEASPRVESRVLARAWRAVSEGLGTPEPAP